MKTRKLLDGSETQDFDYPIDLIIHTKAPGKWRIIDLETGEEYVGVPQPNPKFSETLREKVTKGIIGTWQKYS